MKIIAEQRDNNFYEFISALAFVVEINDSFCFFKV